MEQKFEPKPGEKEFIEKFEQHPNFKTAESESQPEKTKAGIKEFLKELTREIDSIEQIRAEAEIHHESVGEISNILANAVKIALEENALEGLKFLQKTGSSYYIDAYHDLLAGHFYDALVKQGKIKEK